MTQEQALDVLKLGYNVYLTGSAGSGKTYVLNTYIAYLKKEGIAVGVTASTGVAATHINGMTINAWAGFGIKKQLSHTDMRELLKRSYLRKRIQKTKVLVIDEISMLPDYCLDILDRICKAFKNSDKPFGGIQVILCGDLFQLPPVASDMKYHFIYTSTIWQHLNLRICYLESEYRQDDHAFLQVLHEIRKNTIGREAIKLLAARIYKPITTVATRLYTTNVNVDAINTQELAKLEGIGKRYSMKGVGNDYLAGIMKKSCLAPEILILKKGAVVMFVKNNFEKGYANGTLGKVVDFTEKGYPIVSTTAGNEIIATPEEWSIEEEGALKAQIKQIPLRLAWAITIHKSQGMTIDAAEIDLRNPFMPGMGYVALSRVRTLEGIRLMGLNHKALVVNKEILAFDKTLKHDSEKTVEELEKMDWMDIFLSQSLFLRSLKKTYGDNKKPLYKHLTTAR